MKVPSLALNVVAERAPAVTVDVTVAEIPPPLPALGDVQTMKLVAAIAGEATRNATVGRRMRKGSRGQVVQVRRSFIGAWPSLSTSRSRSRSSSPGARHDPELSQG
jgi:hypothetical protein